MDTFLDSPFCKKMAKINPPIDDAGPYKACPPLVCMHAAV